MAERIVITFHTTAEAMALEKQCRIARIPGRLISAPRSLTPDCGIAWASPASEKETLFETVLRFGLEYDKIREL